MSPPSHDNSAETTGNIRGENSGSQQNNLASLVGRVIDGKYRVIEKIGSGGMGTIYRALQLSLDRDVALKVLWGGDDEAAQVRFYREASLAAQLRHPNTVRIFDFGVSSLGMMYIIMELLDGQSLKDAIRHKGALQSDQALAVAKHICFALEEAHSNDIIHRDIKPSNIFVTYPSSTLPFAKLIDFGLVKQIAFQHETTATGSMGTPMYMSPEQLRNNAVDHRSDIYALGMTLYYGITGKNPYDFTDLPSLIAAQLNDDLSWPNINISSTWKTIITKATAKDPNQRYQSVSAFLKALQLAEERNLLYISSTYSPETDSVQPPPILLELEEDSLDEPVHSAEDNLTSQVSAPTAEKDTRNLFQISLTKTSSSLPSPLSITSYSHRLIRLLTFPICWLQEKKISRRLKSSDSIASQDMLHGATPAFRILICGGSLLSKHPSIGQQIAATISQRTNRAVLWEQHAQDGLSLEEIHNNQILQVPPGRLDLCIIVPDEQNLLQTINHAEVVHQFRLLHSKICSRFEDVPTIYLSFQSTFTGISWPLSLLLTRRSAIYNHAVQTFAHEKTSCTTVQTTTPSAFYTEIRPSTQERETLVKQIIDTLAFD